jgi:hypothetical protein
MPSVHATYRNAIAKPPAAGRNVRVRRNFVPLNTNCDSAEKPDEILGGFGQNCQVYSVDNQRVGVRRASVARSRGLASERFCE